MKATINSYGEAVNGSGGILLYVACKKPFIAPVPRSSSSTTCSSAGGGCCEYEKTVTWRGKNSYS